MINKTIMGATLIAAAAVAFSVVPAASYAKAHSKKVECYGAQGAKDKAPVEMMKMTAKACKKAGGSLEKPATTVTTETAPATTATTEAPATTTETPAS